MDVGTAYPPTSDPIAFLVFVSQPAEVKHISDFWFLISQYTQNYNILETDTLLFWISNQIGFPHHKSYQTSPLYSAYLKQLQKIKRHELNMNLSFLRSSAGLKCTGQELLFSLVANACGRLRLSCYREQFNLGHSANLKIHQDLKTLGSFNLCVFVRFIVINTDELWTFMKKNKIVANKNLLKSSFQWIIFLKNFFKIIK